MAKPEDFVQLLIRRLLPQPYRRRIDQFYKHHAADCVVVSFPKCGRTWLHMVRNRA